MTSPPTVALENVIVRKDRTELFLRITKMLFNRRHVLRLGQWDQIFQVPELVSTLRSVSDAYRARSTEQDGPIPVELGFLDLRGQEVVCVASPWPAEAHIELIFAMLQEWVEPQGRLLFGELSFDFSSPAQD